MKMHWFALVASLLCLTAFVAVATVNTIHFYNGDERLQVQVLVSVFWALVPIPLMFIGRSIREIRRWR